MRRFSVCLFLTLAFTAVLPPAADAFKRNENPRDGYTLALFPTKVIANWGEGYAERTETLAAEGILNMTADDSLLRLKYAYLKMDDATDTILLENTAGGPDLDVWRQSSLLSNFTPDWHKVKSFGSAITADLAILVRIRAEDSLVVIYLYDFKSGKKYSKTSQGVYWGSVATGIEKISEALIREFYDQQ